MFVLPLIMNLCDILGLLLKSDLLKCACFFEASCSTAAHPVKMFIHFINHQSSPKALESFTAAAFPRLILTPIFGPSSLAQFASAARCGDGVASEWNCFSSCCYYEVAYEWRRLVYTSFTGVWIDPLPVCRLLLPPATQRDSPSASGSLSLTLCLTFTCCFIASVITFISHLALSVISFYQCHLLPILLFTLLQTHLHIPHVSSSECEEASAPPYGLSSSSSVGVGGAWHCSVSLKKEKEGGKSHDVK